MASLRALGTLATRSVSRSRSTSSRGGLRRQPSSEIHSSAPISGANANPPYKNMNANHGGRPTISTIRTEILQGAASRHRHIGADELKREYGSAFGDAAHLLIERMTEEVEEMPDSKTGAPAEIPTMNMYLNYIDAKAHGLGIKFKHKDLHREESRHGLDAEVWMGAHQEARLALQCKRAINGQSEFLAERGYTAETRGLQIDKIHETAREAHQMDGAVTVWRILDINTKKAVGESEMHAPMLWFVLHEEVHKIVYGDRVKGSKGLLHITHVHELDPEDRRLFLKESKKPEDELTEADRERIIYQKCARVKILPKDLPDIVFNSREEHHQRIAEEESEPRGRRRSEEVDSIGREYLRPHIRHRQLTVGESVFKPRLRQAPTRYSDEGSSEDDNYYHY